MQHRDEGKRGRRGRHLKHALFPVRVSGAGATVLLKGGAVKRGAEEVVAHGGEDVGGAHDRAAVDVDCGNVREAPFVSGKHGEQRADETLHKGRASAVGGVPRSGRTAACAAAASAALQGVALRDVGHMILVAAMSPKANSFKTVRAGTVRAARYSRASQVRERHAAGGGRRAESHTLQCANGLTCTVTRSPPPAG